MGALTPAGVKLQEIRVTTREGTVQLTARVAGEGVTDAVLNQTIQRLAVEPCVLRLHWDMADES